MGVYDLIVTINRKIISFFTLKFPSPTIFLLYESGGKVELTETNIKFYFTFGGLGEKGNRIKLKKKTTHTQKQTTVW